jgi:CBS domain-containing protein
MHVKELMTRDLDTCRPDATLHDAAALMRETDCGIVPVIGADGELAGVLTDRDICLTAQSKQKKLGDLVVQEAASTDVTTVQEDDDIDAVHKAMRERRVRRVPVIDGDQGLVGMVSINDLSRAAADDDEESVKLRQVATTLAKISEPTPRPRA